MMHIILIRMIYLNHKRIMVSDDDDDYNNNDKGNIDYKRQPAYYH